MANNDTNPCDKGLNPFADFDYGHELKRSIIAEYCLRKIKNDSEHEQCIWIAVRRGKQYALVDIPIASNTPTIGIENIRKRYSWWKRHSLYSAVGVKEVKARALHFDDATQRISAVVTPWDQADAIAKLDKEIERVKEEDVIWDECSIDVMGNHHDPNEYCHNSTLDEHGGYNYCKRAHLDSLIQMRDNYDWVTSMLEYYWHNGIDGAGIAFLKRSGFIDEYKTLMYNKYYDAANPYGQTIHAFLILEGWNVRLILLLVGTGIFLTVCIVSIVTAVTHDFEVGLTAGSYAASLLAVLLAVFAFLSVVL